MVKRKTFEKDESKETKHSIFESIKVAYSSCFMRQISIENHQYSNFHIFMFSLLIHLLNTSTTAILYTQTKSEIPSAIRVIQGFIKRFTYTTASCVIFSILITEYTKLKIQTLVMIFECAVIQFSIFQAFYCLELVEPRLLFSLFFLISHRKIWFKFDTHLSGIRKYVLKIVLILFQVLIYIILRDSVFMDL